MHNKDIWHFKHAIMQLKLITLCFRLTILRAEVIVFVSLEQFRDNIIFAMRPFKIYCDKLIRFSIRVASTIHHVVICFIGIR